MKIVEKVSMPLFEIGHGPKEVKFALINSKGETLTPFCKCKDYFNDMMWSKKTGQTAVTCGFTWNPSDDKGELDKDTITMAVRVQDRTNNNKILDIDKEQLKGIIGLLTRINDGLGFKPIVVDVCEENKHIILTYDKSWSDYPYLYSAFFFVYQTWFYLGQLRRHIRIL